MLDKRLNKAAMLKVKADLVEHLDDAVRSDWCIQSSGFFFSPLLSVEKMDSGLETRA